MTPIETLIDKIDSELYLARLSALRAETDSVEHHARNVALLAEELRRECFLMTHKSGEPFAVKPYTGIGEKYKIEYHVEGAGEIVGYKEYPREKVDDVSNLKVAVFTAGEVK